MIERYSMVRGRIIQEINRLSLVVERVEKGLEKALNNPQDAELFLDSVALNLHDFYSGLERVFQYIAVHMDQHVPIGGDWHRELLRQMQLEIHNVRPAVISTETMERLDEYLRFRHVVRNVYTFQFDPERLGRLVKDLRISFVKVNDELQDFIKFLDQMMMGD